MIKEEEYLIFINEIGWLIEEYKNCSSKKIKKLIEEHINLFENVFGKQKMHETAVNNVATCQQYI